jgi:hypothetical protein
MSMLNIWGQCILHSHLFLLLLQLFIGLESIAPIDQTTAERPQKEVLPQRTLASFMASTV